MTPHSTYSARQYANRPSIQHGPHQPIHSAKQNIHAQHAAHTGMPPTAQPAAVQAQQQAQQHATAQHITPAPSSNLSAAQQAVYRSQSQHAAAMAMAGNMLQLSTGSGMPAHAAANNNTVHSLPSNSNVKPAQPATPVGPHSTHTVAMQQQNNGTAPRAPSAASHLPQALSTGNMASRPPAHATAYSTNAQQSTNNSRANMPPAQSSMPAAPVRSNGTPPPHAAVQSTTVNKPLNSTATSSGNSNAASAGVSSNTGSSSVTALWAEFDDLPDDLLTHPSLYPSPTITVTASVKPTTAAAPAAQHATRVPTGSPVATPSPSFHPSPNTAAAIAAHNSNISITTSSSTSHALNSSQAVQNHAVKR